MLWNFDVHRSDAGRISSQDSLAATHGFDKAVIPKDTAFAHHFYKELAVRRLEQKKSCRFAFHSKRQSMVE
jgi:hypothetical protein